MLGTRSKSKNNAAQNGSLNGTATASGTCVIAKGTSITGKFAASEDVRLDGVIEGDVKCDKRLVMGETGRVKGTIHAADAVIMGTIEGELILSLIHI